jgi:ribosomal protein S12 methylthiotransferase
MAKKATLSPTKSSKRLKTIQTVAFVSLGCPKNLVDSERMLGLLAMDGLAITPDAADADAIVINTCGFLEASKTESMAEIRDAVRMKQEGKCQRVIVAGCLVQRHKTKLLADEPGIDRLVGVFDREHIVDAVRGKTNPRQEHGHYLGKYHDLSRELAAQQGSGLGVQGSEQAHGDDLSSPSSSLTPEPRTLNPARETKTNRLPVFENDKGRLRLTPRHYAYLRISEGCNQGCTFCTIPSIRGLMRSKPLDQILAEARELAADGAVELNLIGQDTTSFGTDIGYAPGLAGLLRTLDKELTDVHWLRLMYAYPSCFSDEMIRTIADCARVVPYIDMPLQHINDQILSQMRRRVTRREIETLLGKLRKWIPNIAIRTTFIAGSPGETDAQHAELVKFVADFGFEMMGVFPYSQEPGTPMGRLLDQLPDAVKQQRVEELMLTQQQVAFARSRKMVGQSIDVLIDRPAGRDAEDGFVARGLHQAPDIDSVTFVHGENLHPGQLLGVKVTDFQAYDLVAEVPRKKSRSLSVIKA